MNIMLRPTSPTTTSQILVICWCFVLALFAFGVFLVYVSYGQTVEKLGAAVQVRWRGFEVIGASVVFGGLIFLVRRFVRS